MSGRVNAFDALLAHWKEMVGSVDAFHCNSTVSKAVWCPDGAPARKADVFPVTHAGITDRRTRRTFPAAGPLRLAFVGNTRPYKGLPMLIKVLSGLDKAWELTVYGVSSLGLKDPRIKVGGRFASEDLERIYDGTDLLVVPSLCRETFSLTALEALSFGVPVLVSTTVGARDIISRIDPSFVCEMPGALAPRLSSLMEDRSPLSAFNEKWCSMPWEWDLRSHMDRLDRLYETVNPTTR